MIEPRFKTLEDLRAENPVEDEEEETLSEPDSHSIEAEEAKDDKKDEEKDEEIVHAPLVEKNVHSVH